MKNPETTTHKSDLDVETDELLEAMRNADMVTVEFGTGDMPLLEAQDAVRFDDKNLYVGVNIDPLQHELLAEKVSSNKGFAVLADFSKESINLSPLPAESVDAVYMGNVLGEPNSDTIGGPFKDADGKYHGNSDWESKIATLEEVVRLLKPAGELILLETHTPYINSTHRHPGDRRYVGATEILEALHLEITQALDQKDPLFYEAVTDYATPDDSWSYWSYLVVAKKPVLLENDESADE